MGKGKGMARKGECIPTHSYLIFAGMRPTASPGAGMLHCKYPASACYVVNVIKRFAVHTLLGLKSVGGVARSGYTRVVAWWGGCTVWDVKGTVCLGGECGRTDGGWEEPGGKVVGCRWEGTRQQRGWRGGGEWGRMEIHFELRCSTARHTALACLYVLYHLQGEGSYVRAGSRPCRVGWWFVAASLRYGITKRVGGMVY